MLYRFLKIVIGLAIKLYFRKITIKNLDLVPDNTPIIFAPNHTGAFMDPLVIASVVKQQLNFLARGESFSNSVSRWVFGNLNMIPIYRASETPELMHKNKDVFKRAFDLLEHNGAIIIFPEGNSITERRIRKIKTGAARIALGAEAQNNYNLGVKIIPIGINYTNLHRFQSDVFINFAEPISMTDYVEAYQQDQFGTVNKITDLIHDQLEDHTVVVVSEELDEFIEHIEEIYKSDLKREAEIADDDKEGDFRVSKDIAEAVAYYQREEPLRLTRVRQKMDEYILGLKRLELKDHALGKSKSGSLVKGVALTIIQTILGLPFFLYGALNSFLPYKIPGVIAGMGAPNFYAAVSLSVGIVTFSTFYTAQIWAFDTYITGVYLESWATLLYGITLPLSGMFSLIFWRGLIKNQERWHFISSFYRKTVLTAKLITMRDEIIRELGSAKVDYFEAIDNAEEAVPL